MTWGGAQGFQTPIAPDSFTIGGFGVSDVGHQERGLAYYEAVPSGHVLPRRAPWVRGLQSRNSLTFLSGRNSKYQYLMGERNDL